VKYALGRPLTPETGVQTPVGLPIATFAVLGKGTDFNKVTRREIKKVRDMLNGRPRKSLNREKPCDVYQQVLR